MYRNIGNFSRSCDPSSGAGSPRPTTANSRTADSDITTTQAEQHKLSLGNSAGFVPSLNTITSSQDLQWLVQPSLWPQTAGPPAPPLPPYPTQGTVRCSPSPLLHHPVPPPRGTIARPPSTRRRPDEHLTPEELERRRIRRERNKLAAAKCRDRRRVLTDTLQTETDRLESDKAELQREIAGLEKEKERLELVLEAHRPICKIHSSDSDSDHSSGIPAAAPKSRIKTEPEDPPVAGPSHQRHQRPSKPKITLPASSRNSSPPDTESLHTPTFISTPSLTPFTASLVFTYPPAAPPDPGAPATAPHHFSPPPSSSAPLGTIHSASTQRPQACATAHRRSSSSGDQSDHSLNSPTLVTL